MNLAVQEVCRSYNCVGVGAPTEITIMLYNDIKLFLSDFLVKLVYPTFQLAILIHHIYYKVVKFVVNVHTCL